MEDRGTHWSGSSSTVNKSVVLCCNTDNLQGEGSDPFNEALTTPGWRRTCFIENMKFRANMFLSPLDTFATSNSAMIFACMLRKMGGGYSEHDFKRVSPFSKGSFMSSRE